MKNPQQPRATSSLRRLGRFIEAILLTATEPVTPGRLVDLLAGYNRPRYPRGHRRAQRPVRSRPGTGSKSSNWLAAINSPRAKNADLGCASTTGTSRQVRLSPAGLEVLAIVAFKQPVTRVEIDNIRGR